VRFHKTQDEVAQFAALLMEEAVDDVEQALTEAG
jgi:hypothetical protein